MKTSKTMILTVLIAASALLTSCSKNDNGGEKNTIIGKWQLEQRFENGVEEPLSEDCEKNSTMEFKTDNTFIDMGSFYEPNSPCISSTDPGTWEYNGDNAIKAIYDGSDTTAVVVTFTFVNGNLILVSGDTKSIWKRIN